MKRFTFLLIAFFALCGIAYPQGALTVDNTTGAIKAPVSAATFKTGNSIQATLTLGTGVQTALGVNIGSAGAPILFNGAGGTPSSMTGTNITGIPESGVTNLTSDLSGKQGTITFGTGVQTALGVNIGSAGAPLLFNGAGGTPSSMTGTNITGIPESGVTSLVSDLALKAPLASPTFTGTVTLPSGQALIAPALGTPVSGTLNDSLTYGHDLTAVPNATGGWKEYFVTGSPATTTGQTLVDVTGLVSDALSAATLYEVDGCLYTTTSADTTGVKYALNTTGTGGSGILEVLFVGNSTTGTAVGQYVVNAFNTGGTTVMTTSGQSGVHFFHGFVKTPVTTGGALSVQHVKITSGTSTVNVGSILRIRKAHP